MVSKETHPKKIAQRNRTERNRANSVKTQISQSGSCCFKPSQPHRIILGLRETFIKRYIVERTTKAEIALEGKSEKAESFVGRIYGMK